MTEPPEDRPHEEKASAKRRGHSRWETTKAKVRARREEELRRADIAAADDSDVEETPTAVFDPTIMPPEVIEALGPAIVKDVAENGWPRYRRRQEETLEAERQRLLANGGVDDGDIVFASPEARDAFRELTAAGDPAANLIERIERNKEGIAATVEPITAAEIRDVLAIVDGPVYPANEELSAAQVAELREYYDNTDLSDEIDNAVWEDDADEGAAAQAKLDQAIADGTAGVTIAPPESEGGASSNIDPPGGYAIPDEVKAYINREVANLNDFAAVDFAPLMAAMDADNHDAFELALEDLGLASIIEGVDLAWREAAAKIVNGMDDMDLGVATTIAGVRAADRFRDLPPAVREVLSEQLDTAALEEELSAGARRLLAAIQDESDPELLEGSSLDSPQARAISSNTPPEAVTRFAEKMAGLQAMSDGDESSVLDAVRDVVLKQAINALSAHGYLVVKRGMELPADRQAEVEELLRPRNLLWSNKYHMWWLPDAKGYTPDRDKAGRYRDSEAIDHYRRSVRSMDVPNAAGIYIPATIIVPV